MKYTGAKIKKARRLGIALTPKSEKYLDTCGGGVSHRFTKKIWFKPMVVGLKLR